MSEEETPPSRFESEMTRLMNLAIDKIGGLETKVSGLETKISGLEAKTSSLIKEVAKNNQKLDVLTGQFSDVASMVIGDNKRITKLEGEVAELQSNIH
jgi:uncharacterized coiled-coil protein SlyX